MNEAFNATGQIQLSVDPSTLFSVSKGDSLSLTDQIQFSSLLKTFVETPQEALTAAHLSKKPNYRLNNNRTYDDRGRSDSTHIKGAIQDDKKFNVQPEKLSSENFHPRLDKAEMPKVASINQGNLSGSTPNFRTNDVRGTHTISNNNNVNPNSIGNKLRLTPANHDSTTLKNASKVIGHSLNSQSAVQPLIPSNQSNQKTLQISQVSPDHSASLPSNKMIKSYSPILTRTIDSSNGQNLNEVDLKLSNNSRNHNIAKIQAQDLANRIGNQPNLQITVKNQTLNQQSAATKSLFVNSNSTANNFNIQGENFLGSNLEQFTNSTSSDRQTPNSHINKNNMNISPGHQPNNIGANTPQAFRLESQPLNTQNAPNITGSLKIASVGSEISNQSSINSLTASNQTSQTGRMTSPFVAKSHQAPPPATEQVSIQIQKAVAQGADRVNIKLHPAHLGRIEVRLDFAPDGQLSAMITAEKSETLELLQRDIKGLERALQQAGLDTNSNNFNFSLKQSSEQQQAINKESQDSNPEEFAEDEDYESNETDDGNLLAQNTAYQNLSTDGGIDISV